MSFLDLFRKKETDSDKQIQLREQNTKLTESLLLAQKNSEDWKREAETWRNEAQLWRDKYLEAEKKPPMIIETHEVKETKTEFSKSQKRVYDTYLDLLDQKAKDPNFKLTTKLIAEKLKEDLNSTRVKINRMQTKLKARGDDLMDFDSD